MKPTVSVVIATAVSIFVTVPAVAQFANAPVYQQPSIPTGLAIMADVAFGVNDDSKLRSDFDNPITYGVRAIGSFSVATVMLGYMRVDPGDPNDPKELHTGNSFGGALALRMYDNENSPLTVSLQGGFARTSFEVEGVSTTDSGFVRTDWPLSVALGLKLPAGAAKIVPWVSGRIHTAIRDAEFIGVTERTKAGWGVGLGLNVWLPVGLSFQTAIDYYQIDFGTIFTGFDYEEKPLVVGISGGWRFAMPSFGEVGGLIGS